MKKGLYRENIEVGVNVNNILMLVAEVLEGATPPTTQQLQVKCFFFFSFLKEVMLWVRFNLFEKLDSKYMILKIFDKKSKLFDKRFNKL